MKNSKAFTLIELIFVIIVLGILSAIALPKFTSTGTQARIASGKADVMAIRSAIISERQERLIRGEKNYITASNLDNGGLFGGVLTYPKQNSNTSGNWYAATTGSGTYQYNIDGTNVQFDYNSSTGTFTCTSGSSTQAQKYCRQMIY
ncbi:type IV pilin protein [Sulfurimonas microaerophilic]|uniref:type IV pilin protein n=1 Tax=Sulfurimonas microaerophilic TaxID=3058392 RepID=UPI002714BBFE|nr:type II secretion system protein [Sulfurimonas sp. hsl 1-7]